MQDSRILPPLRKRNSTSKLSFFEYPTVPLDYIPSVSPQAREIAAKGLGVRATALYDTLATKGSRILGDTQSFDPSVKFVYSRNHSIPQQATISFQELGLPDTLPTHVLIVHRKEDPQYLHAFPTHFPVLLANCASISPQIALAPSPTVRPSNITRHAFELHNVPTKVLELPDTSLFPQLHEWLYTHQTLDLVQAILSAPKPQTPHRFGPPPPIPPLELSLPPQYIRLLGSSSQPETRSKAMAGLHDYMLENFSLDAFAHLLNRIRGVKSNIIALQISDPDLHLTLDGLWNVGYQALQVVVEKKSRDQKSRRVSIPPGFFTRH